MATTPSLPRDTVFECAKMTTLLGGRFIETIKEWRQRSRSRRELLALDQRDLCDVRLTRCDVLAEANKPFWKK